MDTRSICSVAAALLCGAHLARAQEVPVSPEKTPASPVALTPPATSGYDDGFFLRSADGTHELNVGGLLQFGANYWGSDRDPESEFDVRRMRLEVSGRMARTLRFNLEPNFLPEGTEMEEAWFGLDLRGGDATLMLGRMKAPFGLEEVRSRKHIDFPRFSILNQFVPAEDHGVFLNGATRSGAFEYGLAAYNGSGGEEVDGSKDVAARVMWHPFAGRRSSALEHLGLGLAGTWGSQDSGVGEGAVDNELGLPVIEFDDALVLDGRRWRLGVEAAWWRAPWFAQAELLAMSQEMALGAVDSDIAFGGAYVTAARVLTGEQKSFGRLAPASPFDFETFSGAGAWILAARYSELHSDDDLEALGFAEAGTFTDVIRTASLGLHWIADAHVQARLAVVRTLYDDEVALSGGSTDDETAVLLELQLAF